MKKILALLLVVLVFSGSALAFAWWDNLETSENDITVGVGEGVTISVNLDEQTSGTLVPEGVVMKTGDIDEVIIDYTVSLSRSDLVNPLDLIVTVDNLQVGGEIAHTGLINVDVTNPGTIHNASVEVTITITLDEPGDEAAYNAVANEDITFDITFEAQQQ